MNSDEVDGRLLALLPGLAPSLRCLEFSLKWHLDASRWYDLNGEPASNPGAGWSAELHNPWPLLGQANLTEWLPRLRHVECRFVLHWHGVLLEQDDDSKFRAWLTGWTERVMAGAAEAGLLTVVIVQVPSRNRGRFAPAHDRHAS